MASYGKGAKGGQVEHSPIVMPVPNSAAQLRKGQERRRGYQNEKLQESVNRAL